MFYLKVNIDLISYCFVLFSEFDYKKNNNICMETSPGFLGYFYLQRLVLGTEQDPHYG